MHVGAYFDLRNPPGGGRSDSWMYGFTLELCEEAERAGLASVWVTEHHLFPDGYLTQPLTYAAAIAARTRRVRIGTAITIAPFRTAVHLAEEATVVDLISDGRLELGLGTGYRVPEYQLFNADLDHRYANTDARVREIRSLWESGGLTPAPVQERPRIWLGYNGPQGARRAGMLGESLLSANPALVEPYRAGLTEGGHDPARGIMAGPVRGFVTADPDQDWPVVSRHLAYQWNSYRAALVQGTGQPVPRPIDPDLWRSRGLRSDKAGFLLATPERAAAELTAHFASAPVHTVFFFASIAGLPEPMVVQHIQNLGALAKLLQPSTCAGVL